MTKVPSKPIALTLSIQNESQKTVEGIFGTVFLLLKHIWTRSLTGEILNSETGSANEDLRSGNRSGSSP